jgi:hypothetical protein
MQLVKKVKSLLNTVHPLPWMQLKLKQHNIILIRPGSSTIQGDIVSWHITLNLQITTWEQKANASTESVFSTFLQLVDKYRTNVTNWQCRLMSNVLADHLPEPNGQDSKTDLPSLIQWRCHPVNT